MTLDKSTPAFRQTLNESAWLLRQDRPADALALLQPLLDQDPTDPDLAINTGGALILQRKWDRAVDVLERAARANPDKVMLWINLGAARLGRLETAGPRRQAAAIEAYARALAIDPAAPNVHYHLALIYKEQGDLDQAEHHFTAALESDPGDRDARRWLDRLKRIQAEQARARHQQMLTGTANGDEGSHG